MSLNFKNASETDRKAEFTRLAKEAGDDRAFVKKELNYLPEVLMDNEEVITFASGFMDGNSWLVTLTDKRIIFLDKGMFFGLKQTIIDLDKVNAVSCITGMILGSVMIQDGALIHKIENVANKTVTFFTNKVRDAIEVRKTPNVTQSPVIDVVSQLERLSVLKEKGILTQDEFNQQKTKILENKH